MERIEISESYCEVANQRIKKVTNKIKGETMKIFIQYFQNDDKVDFRINNLKFNLDFEKFKPIKDFLKLNEVSIYPISIKQLKYIVDYFIDSELYLESILIINHHDLHQLLKDNYDLRLKCQKCKSVINFLKQPIKIEYTRYYSPYFSDVGFVFIDDYEPQEIEEKYICTECEKELSLEEIWYIIKRNDELIETDVNALKLKFEVWKTDRPSIVVEQWDGYKC